MYSILFFITSRSLVLVSKLPLRFLYLISDAIYYLLYYILRYRLPIARNNLQNSFPGKSEKELNTICKLFYRHLSDVIVETVKLISITPENLSGRVKIVNPEVLNAYYKADKSVVAVIAHYGNWEWLTGLAPAILHRPVAVYKPLNNKRFNHFINIKRGNSGVKLINMREIIPETEAFSSEEKPTLFAFIADQSPVWEEIQYWGNFLNQITPVYLGPEKIAVKTGIPVVFLKMNKIKRGCYEVEVIPVEENPLNTAKFEITDKHLTILENIIKEKPELWLWTHRRWKLTRKREMEEKKGVFRFNENNLRNKVLC